MKVIVMHEDYGCDTGCCGHAIYLHEDDGRFVDREFTFGHPWDDEDRLAWAKERVAREWGAEHVADLDWDRSFVTGDC